MWERLMADALTILVIRMPLSSLTHFRFRAFVAAKATHDLRVADKNQCGYEDGEESGTEESQSCFKS